MLVYKEVPLEFSRFDNWFSAIGPFNSSLQWQYDTSPTRESRAWVRALKRAHSVLLTEPFVHYTVFACQHNDSQFL